MSLIEQLGGYAQAKNYAVDANACGAFDDEKKIKQAILEYRRQHNIFEVGDDVVYKGEAGLEAVFQIETLTKTGKPKTVKTKRFGNFPCRYCTVRHATDAEISAGKRL